MTHRPGGSQSATGGDRPPSPPAFALLDEHPGRRDLLRQIADLERRLAELATHHGIWEMPTPGVQRGPSLLCLEELEQVRDELFTALSELRRQVLAGELRRLREG